MATIGKFLMQDCLVKIAGQDYSSYAFNIDLSLQREDVDVTGFNNTQTKETLPGDKTEEATVQFMQSFGTATGTDVDAMLWGLYNSGSAVALVLNPTSGTVSPSNPNYSGSAQVYEYHPLNGARGARSETSVTFRFVGAVSRGTS